MRPHKPHGSESHGLNSPSSWSRKSWSPGSIYQRLLVFGWPYSSSTPPSYKNPSWWFQGTALIVLWRSTLWSLERCAWESSSGHTFLGPSTSFHAPWTSFRTLTHHLTIPFWCSWRPVCHRGPAWCLWYRLQIAHCCPVSTKHITHINPATGQWLTCITAKMLRYLVGV